MILKIANDSNCFKTIGTVPTKLSKSLEQLRVGDVIESFQTSELISTTTITRKVINL